MLPIDRHTSELDDAETEILHVETNYGLYQPNKNDGEDGVNN